MRTLLLWRRDPASPSSAEAVGARLRRLLEPILEGDVTTWTAENGVASLVFLEQPVRGWNAPLREQDDRGWVIAAEYPFGSTPRSLRDRLEQNPLATLAEQAPPFALVWSGRGDSEVNVQNDGLGQAQLFEYDDGRLWALTNRISAFTALGARVEPDPEQWAVRTALGWFPLQLTGYRNVRFVAPGTRFTLSEDGVGRTTIDAVGRWVNPDPLPAGDCLELARTSLMRSLEQALPLWDRPSVGLSGGWDTRAVVATLRSLDADFSARVRGSFERPDVRVATELAEIAGFPLRVRSQAGLPPETPEACRHSISLALRWQAGYMVSAKHKTFLARQKGLDGGVVNVMGQHGEIGRAYYAKRIRATELDETEYEDALLRSLLANMPPFTREDLREHVRDTVRAAYRQADRYALSPLRRLDFFYLYERTRRWASGSLASQDGIVFAPFLNPDYVRAVFAFPERTDANPFHRYIVERHAPDWLHVPYADEVARRDRRVKEHEADWRQPRGNHHYDSRLYWRTVAAPLIEEALTAGGWWTQVFDPVSAAERWEDGPDELAIAHLLPQAFV